MMEHEPQHHGGWRPRVMGLAMSVLALGGVLPADSDLTRPQVYYAEDAEVFEGDELLIMSANVFGWESLLGGTNEEEFLDLLRSQQPNVVCGQEWKENPELFKKIRELGYSYAIAPTRYLPEFTTALSNLGAVGNFILVKDSEMQLESVKTLPGNLVDRIIDQETRNMMHVRIKKTDGSYISIITTHLTNDKADRIDQMQAINDYIVSLDLRDSETYIFCGDLNARTDEVQSSALQHAFGSSTSIRPVFTYPENKYYPNEPSRPIIPDQDIDHILQRVIDPECRVVNAGAEVYTENIGSDHAVLFKRIRVDNCTQHEAELTPIFGPR